MICCLNPNCTQPMNRDTAKTCRTCGAELIPLLRGRYQPVKLIGRGGFGRTYLAYDGDRLNAPCVIKQFAPQAQGTKSFNKAVQLFNQEAVRLHELGEHPQIPALLAYFEHEQYLYLVQQFIDGSTLIQEIVQNGPMDEAGIRTLLLELLPVLDFIHSHSVVHRDITPANLIRRDTDRRLFVIDFGIAKQFGEALAYEPGTRIGTEGYAPIEQLRSGQAYPCSDIYSLGATCLHLLTGRKPEHLYDPMEGAWRWREILAKQGLVMSQELGAVLDRMVMDTVSERYQTANEVLDDLKRLPTLQGNVPGWVRQHPSGRLSETETALPISSPRRDVPISIPPTSPPAEVGEPVVAPIPQAASPAPAGMWQCARLLTGHQSWVTAIAFNPRTATLVSGSLDDSIKVWNLQTGSLMFTLQGHPGGVNDVTISAKGQVLVSCGDDETVRVWNLTAGRRLHTLKGHVRDVTGVAIGHQGWILASCSKDRTINIWKLDTGTLVRTLMGSPAAIKSVDITPDESLVLSGGLDNKIRLWNLNTGEMVRTLSGHLASVNDLAVSRDGLFVASASKDRTVRLWSIATGAQVHCLMGHSQEVNSVAIAPDNRTIVSGSSDGTVRIWDAKTGTLQHTLAEHTNAVTAVDIHRTGRFIASASADKTIRVWKWVTP
ncbi:MAG: serine/threonine protein kinase [Leptolyngbyaceae cyanobacterium T60_A2020_046]|nr:serine/threonine protein kinase [Leptolyngbyaceae cyanobacterium T60_A2020_046]